MKPAEVFALLGGALVIVTAVTAIDWRLGLLTLGGFLIASGIEIPRSRT